jgi:signal peptidase II
MFKMLQSFKLIIKNLLSFDASCSRIILFVFLLDQISKFIIFKMFNLYEVKNVIPGIFNIRFNINYGAAFSLLNDAPVWFRKPFFIIVPALVMIFIYILLSKTKDLNKYEKLGYSLVLGGALGNFADRLTYGFVIDFLDIYYKNYHWPTFNVADIAITFAVVFLFIGFRHREKIKKRTK